MQTAPPKFLDPHAEIRHTASRLPHWQQPGATYFLTFHLADSVPRELREQWIKEREGWLRANPPPHSLKQELEFHRRFSGAFEQWLDAGHGSCALRDQRCAEIVAGALRHFDGERCRQHAWVVMPNHVHVLVAVCELWTIERLLHSWKRFTARRINEVLGREGALWQRDYFDRLIRDERHFANCVRYIRRNPEKAHLRAGEFVLYESDVAIEVE